MALSAADFLNHIDAKLKALDVERTRLLALREMYAGEDSPPPPGGVEPGPRRFPAIPDEMRVKLIPNATGAKGLTPLIFRVITENPGLKSQDLVRRLQDYIHPETPVARDNLRKQLRYLRNRGRLRMDKDSTVYELAVSEQQMLGE